MTIECNRSELGWNERTIVCIDKVIDARRSRTLRPHTKAKSPIERAACVETRLEMFPASTHEPVLNPDINQVKSFLALQSSGAQ